MVLKKSIHGMKKDEDGIVHLLAFESIKPIKKIVYVRKK